MSDAECVQILSSVWSYVSGGVNSGLMDLAELENGEEVAMWMGEEIDMKMFLLRQLLEDKRPVTR